MVTPNRTKSNLTSIPHSRPTLGEEEAQAVAAVIQSGNIAEGEVVRDLPEEVVADS